MIPDRSVSVFLRYVAVGSLLGSACVPEIEDDTSLVSTARVLAVRAIPAEAAEGEELELSALVASPDGTGRELRWTACRDRKPLTELGPVSPVCLVSADGDDALAPAIGSGEMARLQLGNDACTLFGPERPEPKPGEPAGRPVDADPSGGFYHPVVAWLGSSATLGAVRLSCPLVGAAREATVEYNRRYRRNENPRIVGVERVLANGSGAAPVAFLRGERVRLRVLVPPCPSESACGDGVCGVNEDRSGCAEDCTAPRGCGGTESYAYYDAQTQRVTERRESLVAAWYASRGRFAEERTSAVDAEVLENDWVAPAVAGPVRLWFVVRDDRGGVDWISVEGAVE